MELQNKCTDCNSKGYVNTYNTLINKQEIQRCDTCMKYKSDIHAKEIYNNCNNM